MLYTCRMTYKDETFAISTFPADSWSHAVALCKRDPAVRSVTAIGTVDPKPQNFLAW